MAGDVRTTYTQREKRERRKDRYLGTAVGGSAVGLSVLGNNLERGSLERMRRGARSTNITVNGRRLPRTSRLIGGARAAQGASLKQLAAAGLLGLTAAGGRYLLRDREPKQFVAKGVAYNVAQGALSGALLKPIAAHHAVRGIGRFGDPKHWSKAHRAGLLVGIGAPTVGVPAAAYGVGRRHGGKKAEKTRDVAKADSSWKELKSQTVYGMPSHQTARLGARGRAEAMARSIPDPALPFVAPKGERLKAANAQTKATLSGAALGAGAGLAAGALVGGPKAWKASARGAKRTLAQLKAMRSASRQPTLPGMKPSAKEYAQMARSKAAARFTPQRRADLARGAVGGAVTGAAVNINSARAAKETVASNPKAWERNDRKISDFVNKGEPMPSLAEIAKRAYAEKKSTRDAYTTGGVLTALGGAGGVEYGVKARSASQANRSRSRFNARARNAYMDTSRRNVRDAQRIMEQGREAFGSGSFSTDKARGMRTTMQEAGRHTDMAQRHYGMGREAGRAAANQRRVAMGQARRGKWALAGGAAALAGGTGLVVYGNRRKGKVRKAIEPDVDPGGFLEQVQREQEVLRDSAGRFAGKVVDDVGPAIVATPYPEEE